MGRRPGRVPKTEIPPSPDEPAGIVADASADVAHACGKTVSTTVERSICDFPCDVGRREPLIAVVQQNISNDFMEGWRSLGCRSGGPRKVSCLSVEKRAAVRNQKLEFVNSLSE
jgi:hypothetical protein